MRKAPVPIRLACFCALASGLAALPALAAPADAPGIFGNFFKDMGWLGLCAVGVAGLVMVLKGLQDQGVLSDRWKFGADCDQDND